MVPEDIASRFDRFIAVLAEPNVTEREFWLPIAVSGDRIVLFQTYSRAFILGMLQINSEYRREAVEDLLEEIRTSPDSTVYFNIEKKRAAARISAKTDPTITYVVISTA